MTANVNTIQLKRTVIGTVPSSLQPGELMIDQNKGLMYWADGAGVVHTKLITPEGFGPTQNISNLATGGVLGTAAATVDQYSYFRITQTTAGQNITLPTPTLTGTTRPITLVNSGTVAFQIGTIWIPPGNRISVVWNPMTSSYNQSYDVGNGTARTQVYTSGIFVNTGDFVSYNNILYKYLGTEGLITTAPVTGTLWYPQTQITALWCATAAQTTVTSTALQMAVTSQVNNTDGSITNNGSGTLTMPIAGAYRFDAQVCWSATSAAGARAIILYQNGTLTHLANGIQALATQVYDQLTSRVIVCAAGDTIYMSAVQTSGGNIATYYNSPSSKTWLSATFLAGQ